MSATVALALGCLLQAPWNSLPVIDCNEGPRLYGAEIKLKDGKTLRGYVALAKPLPTRGGTPKLELFKPDCGLTLFRDPEVLEAAGEPEGDCLFDEYATQRFSRAWLPREKTLDLGASRVRSLKLKPLPWDGISTERFTVLTAAERRILAPGGPRVPLTDYQGFGRMELAGGPKVKESQLWKLAKPVAQAVMEGGKTALIEQKKKMLLQGVVLLFYPDVEP